jgi:hypothetical protein
MRYFHPFLITVITTALSGNGIAQDNPQAVIKSPSWDYGYLPQKCEVSHLFFLHNTGSAPLNVTKIKADCSCTGVPKVDHPIAPGDSAAIVVTFKSGRYHGLVRKSAAITTDDPDQPVWHVHFRGNVVKSDESTDEITISPQKLNWKIENGKIAQSADTVRITANGRDNLTVAILNEPREIIAQAKIPRNLDGSADLILIPLKEDIPDTNEWYSITLAFTGSDTTIATIPIRIEK